MLPRQPMPDASVIGARPETVGHRLVRGDGGPRTCLPSVMVGDADALPPCELVASRGVPRRDSRAAPPPSGGTAGAPHASRLAAMTGLDCEERECCGWNATERTVPRAHPPLPRAVHPPPPAESTRPCSRRTHAAENALLPDLARRRSNQPAQPSTASSTMIDTIQNTATTPSRFGCSPTRLEASVSRHQTHQLGQAGHFRRHARVIELSLQSRLAVIDLPIASLSGPQCRDYVI